MYRDTSGIQILPINSRGFSLIEALIAISILSIGFMALTTTLWSSSWSTRTAAFADDSVMKGQEWIERLSVIPIDEDSRLNAGETHEKSTKTPNGTPLVIKYEIKDEEDDFKTIEFKVYHEKDEGDLELKMEGSYRRMTYESLPGA